MGFWDNSTRSPSPARRKHYQTRNGIYYSSSRSNGRGYSSRPRPRTGFVARIRKFLREIFDYLRRNPVKVFFLVIVPLLTSGALQKLFAHIGIRLPRNLEHLIGGEGVPGGGNPGRYYARGGARDYDAGTALPGMSGGFGEALGTVAGIAKHFL
ncbi:hypothetical protein DV738_g2658, partial [Chaetothyriales sp. CBS 135597]